MEAHERQSAQERDPQSDLTAQVIAVLRTIYDPEIPVNIYDLGLIYDVTIDADAVAHVRMTLTSPACPVAGSLVEQVQERVQNVPGVSAAEAELVWDPVWNPAMMSEAARLTLGF